MIQDLGRDRRLGLVSVICPRGVMTLFCAGIACLPTPAFAQLNLSPDNSLGSTVETLNPRTDLVTGGVRSLLTMPPLKACNPFAMTCC